MEMQHMMEHLLAKMDANQEKADRELKEMMKGTQERIKTGQAEVRSIVRAFREKMDTCVASRRDDGEVTMSCQEKLEPRLECDEPISEDIKACQEMTTCHEAMEEDTEKIESYPGMMPSIAEHQVAPKKDAVVKPVEGWKKRHRGRKPAAGRRGWPKEMTLGDCGARRKLAAAWRKVSSCATVAWRKRNLFKKIVTQGNCGSQKEFAAAGIRTTHCAKVARGKEHGLQRQGNDDIAPRTQKGLTEETKRLNSPECKNGVRYQGLRQQLQGKIGIKDPDTRRQLHLRIEKMSNEIFRRKIANQAVGTPRVLQRTMD
jgi:hypothetical protein